MSKRHYVYLIRSLTTNKTYVGYALNPHRRLRQHNGEIVGGAKSTHSGRPWTIICYVTGFPDNSTALQFEWRNHHPIKAWGRRKCAIHNRLYAMKRCLQMDKFTENCILRNSLNLIIVWLDASYLNYWLSLSK
jgi:predicted GIY-YIG superfamily endonuclease